MPAEGVRCAWTVLLYPAARRSILDENNDAERYLLRRVSGSEAAAQVSARRMPVYPPIAKQRMSAVVVINVIVGKSGEVQSAIQFGGPPMLTGAAIDAANHWSFKPLTVGARTVPYDIKVRFTFHTRGRRETRRWR